MERFGAGLTRRIKSIWERRNWDTVEDPPGVSPVAPVPRTKSSLAGYVDPVKEAAFHSWSKEAASKAQASREQEYSLLQQSYPNGPCGACEMIASESIFSHHNSGMLAESAKSGCPICKLLQQIPGMAGYDSRAVIVVDQKRKCIHYESSSNKKSRVTLEMFTPDSHLVQPSQTDPKSNLQNVFTPISAREVYHQPNSPECYSLAKSWIQKCVSQHARCKQDKCKTPPTRLLELVGNKVYLRRSADILEAKPLYATLTYCWGMGETMKTTTETLTEYEGGIELIQLPLTLHDAVIVTKQLGLKYIWIDALCIIQNSQDDWEAECARMGDYYRFSYVTISPLQVQRADNSFLKERPVNPTCPSVVLGGSQLGLRMPIRNDVRGSPLSKRGWTLQERLLATRILHFGKDELLWECLTCSAREGSTAEDTKCEDSSALVQSEGQDFKRCLFNIGSDPYSIKDGAFALWYRIVRSYSQRSLSYSSDKMPAISVIAKAISEHTGSAYLSGIFQSDLHGLVWCDQNNSSKSSFPAPSWSWASVEGPIKYPFQGKDRLGGKHNVKFVSFDPNISSGCLTVRAFSNGVASLHESEHGNESTYYWIAGDAWVLSNLDVDCVDGNRHVPSDIRDGLSISGTHNVTAISICERSTHATEHITYGKSCDCWGRMLEIYTYILLVVPDSVLKGHWRRIGMAVSISAPSCADVEKQKSFCSTPELNTFSLI